VPGVFAPVTEPPLAVIQPWNNPAVPAVESGIWTIAPTIVADGKRRPSFRPFVPSELWYRTLNSNSYVCPELTAKIIPDVVTNVVPTLVAVFDCSLKVENGAAPVGP
jgi:hypothetical protein